MNEALKKIIYVEDDESIAEVATLAMETFGGFEITYFSSGTEVLANIDNINPQMFIIDVMMPGMDGLTLLKKLQESKRFAEVPIIFMTAKVQNSEVNNYLQNGVFGVIHKPFDPVILCEIINDYWSKHLGRQ